uniref:Uncharacterized protein n=1 Tax=Arundo donax TaxID=35708 RepID=A0A0A9EAE0_ARUDO
MSINADQFAQIDRIEYTIVLVVQLL